MADRRDNEIIMEDVKILFPNFSGAKQKFNAEGDRNFCVELSEEGAADLAQKGWNVKRTSQREDGDGTPYGNTPYLQVSVRFNNYPPKIYMLTDEGRKRTLLTEDMVSLLDVAEIIKTDLILTPYNWDVQGTRGIKAYLKDMYVSIYESPLDRKYAQVPSGSASAPEPSE